MSPNIQLHEKMSDDLLIKSKKLSKTNFRSSEDLLKKRCSMNRIRSVEIFSTTPNEVRLHVIGTSKETKKRAHSLLTCEDGTLYEYHQVPLLDPSKKNSSKHKRKVYATNAKTTVVEKMSSSQLPYVQNTLPKVSQKQRKLQKISRLFNHRKVILDSLGLNRARVQQSYLISKELRSTVNQMQNNKEQGSTLLCISDMMSPENHNHGYQYVMPITSTQTAQDFFGTKFSSIHDKITLLRQCIRDNFVAAECLRNKGYIVTDQKLDNSILVQDIDVNTELERTRFAQIDIDDIFNEAYPNCALSYTYAHSHLSEENMEKVYGFSKKERAIIIQLRNFFMMMLNGYLGKDLFHKIRQVLTLDCSYEQLHDTSLEMREHILHKMLQVENWKDYATIAEYRDNFIVPQCINVLKAFGITDSQDIECIKKLLFSPLTLSTPKIKDIFAKNTKEQKDQKFFEENIQKLDTILRKALKVEEYKEPKIATHRQITHIENTGTSSYPSEKVEATNISKTWKTKLKATLSKNRHIVDRVLYDQRTPGMYTKAYNDAI